MTYEKGDTVVKLSYERTMKPLIAEAEDFAIRLMCGQCPRSAWCLDRYHSFCPEAIMAGLGYIDVKLSTN